MAITVHANPKLGIIAVRLGGVLTHADCLELLSFYREHPQFPACDSFYIVDEDIADGGISTELVASLRTLFAPLYTSMDRIVLRRSAWICRTAEACRLVEHWLDGRHSRDGHGAEFCLCANIADAEQLFSSSEIAAVSALEGFDTVAHIDDGVLVAPISCALNA